MLDKYALVSLVLYSLTGSNKAIYLPQDNEVCPGSQ